MQMKPTQSRPIAPARKTWLEARGYRVAVIAAADVESDLAPQHWSERVRAGGDVEPQAARSMAMGQQHCVAPSMGRAQSRRR